MIDNVIKKRFDSSKSLSGETRFGEIEQTEQVVLGHRKFKVNSYQISLLLPLLVSV
jgi:hypothetical protein